MELEGKVILDLGIQQGTSKAGNSWMKHEYVLETFGAYPKQVKFDIFGEMRCNSINLEIGNSYVLTVEANSREFNGRWYTDLTCLAARPSAGPMPAGGMQQPGGFPQAPTSYPQPGQSYQQATPQPFGGNNFPPAPTPGNAPQSFEGDATDDLPF